MKKCQYNPFIYLIGLIITIITLGDLYFYHLGILDALPKFLWFPFCLVLGGALGWVCLFLGWKIKVFLPKIKWFYIPLLIILFSSIVFGFKELFYIPLKANSFSEMKVSFKALDNGNLGDELLVNDIRVDQRAMKWKETCQISGPYRWVRNQALTLESNSEGQGKIECRFYPIKSVNIFFQANTLPDSFEVTTDGISVLHPVLRKAEGDQINLDIKSPINGIVPNLLIFLNISLVVALLILFWGAFQTGEINPKINYPIIWMVSGFLIFYVAYFIYPTYFNDLHSMAFPQTVSTSTPIGADFQWIINRVQMVIFQHRPLDGSYYSPGTFFFFIPFALVDYFLAYKIYSLLKLVVFIAATFLLPIFIRSKKEFTIPLFFLITGLMSYAWEYELERGQGYSLVFALLFISIWLFHKYYSKWPVRFIAYLLFTISIQMKLTPVFFVLFFIRNLRNYKENIIRFASLGVVNLLLVFSTGINNAVAFINSILWVGGTSGSISGMQNHSIRSFVLWVQSTILENISYLLTLILIITVTCLLILVIKFILEKWRNKYMQFDPLIIIGFSLAALLIPSENHDYTLVILPFILSIGFCIELMEPNPRLNVFDIFVLTFLFSNTIFSSVVKPDILFLQNDCPALLLLLLYITLSVWKNDLILFLKKRYLPASYNTCE